MSSNSLLLFGFVLAVAVQFSSCNVLGQAESDEIEKRGVNHPANGGISVNFQQGMRDFIVNGKGGGVGIHQTVIAFQATLSGNAGPNYAHGVIKFNHVTLNIGNGYNPSTGKFTAPVQGLYQFSASYLQQHGYQSHVQLMKGNTVIGEVLANHKNYDQVAKTILVALAKGETFWVKLPRSGSYAIHGGGRYTQLGGFLVSTTIR